MFDRNLLIAAAVIAAPASAGIASAAPALQMARIQTEQPQQQARQAPRPVPKAAFTRNVDSRFAAIDTNNDGFLSKEEIAAAQTRALEQAANTQRQRIEAQFKRLDTNGDGQLSLAEFRAIAPPVRAGTTPEQMLAQLDTNKDGRISAAEYRAPQIANFDRMDTNKDGIVSPAEMEAARRR